MTKRAKALSKRPRIAAKVVKHRTPPKADFVAPTEFATLLDFVRYAVSRFVEAKLAFAHGTTDPVAEAVFLVCETLHLHPDQFEFFATARVTSAEAVKISQLIEQRITTRKPAAYLVKKIYMRGAPFYVDERVIVPRSFLGELLEAHFPGDGDSLPLIEDVSSVEHVLDLCTGSGCLAILAAHHFPHALVDAVDVSRDALDVAARNVGDHHLEQRVTLYHGDLFKPLGDRRYDLIITNPPYVDAQGMTDLPRECRHEPKLAFDGGPDGLHLVRQILERAGDHLNAGGGLLCEVGRGRDLIEITYPDLPLLWLDTEESEGEVFWIDADGLTGRA